ncbi:MAG: hypothetical protein V1647_03055 [Pseudomonadota bacterium]
MLLTVINACSYGFSTLRNPWEKQGVKTVTIPMFKNLTMEGGAEAYFTSSLRFYLTSRSGKLKLVRSNGDAYIKGELKNVIIVPAGVQFGTQATEDAGGLPKDRLLASSYTITATVTLTLIRESDQKQLWSNTTSQSTSMQSGTYTDQRASSDVFIKESQKRLALKQLADTMMTYSVDALLEGF